LLVALLSLVLTGSQPEIASPENLQSLAMDAFHRGIREREEERRGTKEFQEAASHLLEIQRERCLTTEELLLLGDAFFLAGDSPRAILSYHRILTDEPANGRAQDRLNWVRAMTGSREAPEQERRRWSVGEIFPLFAMGYTLLWIGMAIGWHHPGRFLYRAILVGGFCLCLALACLLLLSSRSESRPTVVMAQDQVLLRQGNGPLFPVLRHDPCPRGQEAILLAEQDGWLKIVLPTGESGWVASDAVVMEASLFPGESQRRAKP